MEARLSLYRIGFTSIFKGVIASNGSEARSLKNRFRFLFQGLYFNEWRQVLILKELEFLSIAGYSRLNGSKS